MFTIGFQGFHPCFTEHSHNRAWMVYLPQFCFQSFPCCVDGAFPHLALGLILRCLKLVEWTRSLHKSRSQEYKSIIQGHYALGYPKARQK